MRRSETLKTSCSAAVHDLVDVVGLFVRQRRDLAGRVDEAAQGGGALDDVSVVLDVDGGGDAVDQRGDVGRAAHLLEDVAALQFVHQGNEVGRLAALVQIQDGAVDPAILLAVEVLWLDRKEATLSTASGSMSSEPRTASSASGLAGIVLSSLSMLVPLVAG